MSQKESLFKDGTEALIAVIGDVVRRKSFFKEIKDTVTGFLLAGVGNVSQVNDQANFLIVDTTTGLFFLKTKKIATTVVETAFKKFTTTKNIAIILVTQRVTDKTEKINFLGC
jgi:vacuolar-type H+-ATPase subunit F/Vma7